MTTSPVTRLIIPEQTVSSDPVGGPAPNRRGRTIAWSAFGLFVVLDLVITKLRGHPSYVPEIGFGLNTGVPVVPTNADFPYVRSNNIVAIALMGSLGLVGLGVATREYVLHRTLVPLFLALGTILIVVPEVFVDIVGLVYYPTSPVDHAFTLFGRQMGYFIIAAWFGAGVFALLMFKILQTRPTARTVWTVLAATCIAYTCFEELLVGAGGMYHYYGNQPMWWDRLPLWWTPCNTLGCALLPAAFAVRFLPLLRGWRAAVMLVVVPACLAGGYALIAMPSWVVVNGHYPWLVTQLAGLSTWALGIGTAAVVMKVLLGYEPFDLRSRPALVEAAPAHKAAARKTDGSIR